ncbi:DUF5661 family protein [Methanoculleus chikugoensis]|uniref:DUF5661 family protein n=1 Tax=Methanoculleus chikugoensis TaxID=118126 RepID=UPI001FD2164C|nr:DUF5661 family protein [Methanoculleus chikugoensis]
MVLRRYRARRGEKEASTRPSHATVRLITSKTHLPVTHMARRDVTADEARAMGAHLGITWEEFDVEQFRRGMVVELEHGLRDPATNVTDDDLFLTAKIALAHLNEFPDYYDRLEEMEEEAEAYWAEQKAQAP